MDVVGLRGRLLPGAADAHKRAHDEIPQDLLDLFHVAECEDGDSGNTECRIELIYKRDLWLP